MNCVFLRWGAIKFSIFIQLKHVNTRNKNKVTIYINIYIYVMYRLLGLIKYIYYISFGCYFCMKVLSVVLTY